MKGKKNQFNPKALLWWVAITSVAVSAALYFFLKEQAQYDVALDQRRLLFPLIGIIIAGICIIAGTAGRWFYPK
jgi:threonine/homoserine/homoserine lactone efflux protein